MTQGAAAVLSAAATAKKGVPMARMQYAMGAKTEGARGAREYHATSGFIPWRRDGMQAISKITGPAMADGPA